MQDWCFSNTGTATSNLITHRIAQDVPEHNYSEEMTVICVSKEARALRQQLPPSHLPSVSSSLPALLFTLSHPSFAAGLWAAVNLPMKSQSEKKKIIIKVVGSRGWLTTVLCLAFVMFFQYKRRTEGDPHQGNSCCSQSQKQREMK